MSGGCSNMYGKNGRKVQVAGATIQVRHTYELLSCRVDEGQAPLFSSDGRARYPDWLVNVERH